MPCFLQRAQRGSKVLGCLYSGNLSPVSQFFSSVSPSPSSLRKLQLSVGGGGKKPWLLSFSQNHHCSPSCLPLQGLDFETQKAAKYFFPSAFCFPEARENAQLIWFNEEGIKVNQVTLANLPTAQGLYRMQEHHTHNLRLEWGRSMLGKLGLVWYRWVECRANGRGGDC